MFFHLFKVYPLNGKANNYHICEFSVEKFRLLHLTHLCNKISYLLVYHVNVFPNIPTNRRRCNKSAFKDFFENPPNVILHCKENNLQINSYNIFADCVFYNPCFPLQILKHRSVALRHTSLNLHFDNNTLYSSALCYFVFNKMIFK